MSKATDYPEILERIQNAMDDLKANVKDLETLEIHWGDEECYYDNVEGIHLVYNTEKTPEIFHYADFWQEINQEKDLKQEIERVISETEFVYKNAKYTLNRVDSATEELVSFIMISKEAIDGQKRGLVFIQDTGETIFIATCKLDALRRFNMELMTRLYPHNE